MNPAIALQIVQAILCKKELKAWLEKQAQVSDTPIDDLGLKIIYLVLGCPNE